MDYNQEQFFRMQMDVPKMPFYMSYPMQNLYLTDEGALSERGEDNPFLCGR